MKKSLLIILLCALQSACSTQSAALSGENTLLSYADLANEITVGFEDMIGREPTVQPVDEPLETP